MKIYFCDACNESIPLGDIQAGQVTTIKGKLFCRSCIPPGAGAAPGPAASPAARGASPVLWIALLVVCGYLVWRDLPRTGVLAGHDVEALDELDAGADRLRLSGLEDDLSALRRDRDELDRKLTFLRGDLDNLRAQSADNSRVLEQLREQLDGVVRGQAETGQLIEKLHFQENRLSALDGRINTLADAVVALEQRLAAGIATLAGAEAAPGAAPVVSAADATLQAELDAIRRQLLDNDAGQRFAAVDRISKGRHKVLAAELVASLGDEDLFVRMAAMQTLGDFGHVEAVPRLFEVLADPNASIRKHAAETLVRLTGYDPGYDARASTAERDKAVKKWKDWLGER